jgi:hypothetical protein
VPDRKPGRLAAVRDGTGTIVGSVLGLKPHVLHHVGLIAGTAFLTGAGGSAALYLVGLVLSIPMLRRIHRRFGSWRAPAIAVAVFTAMFLVSALVVGPAISADSATTDAPSPGPTPTVQHTEHHT